MKTLNALILFLAWLLWFPVGAQSGFVTLEGRKFMLNGAEFYPRVMNYSLTTTSNVLNSTNPSDIYCSPDFVYDKNVQSIPECNDQPSCNWQLQAHFAKIISMGFNTIRIGIGPHMRQAGGNYYYGLWSNG